MDTARTQAIDTLKNILVGKGRKTRIVLVDDLFGRLRVIVWASEKNWEKLKSEILRGLREKAGPYWSGEVWNASEADDADRRVQDLAWEQGVEVVPGKLRILDRHRSRGAWLQSLTEPPWSCRRRREPPILVFYSFKGGVGRSTALASYAIHCARRGERVVVIDGDLDAPGVGSLLAADSDGTTADWGVADYLLEAPVSEVDLRDYYHACRRETVTGKGELLVVPAGRVDEAYLGKLARLDFEPTPPDQAAHPLRTLLENVRCELEPSWILLDVRSGLSDPAGLFLQGLAHLHVLFGTFSEQSWHGIRVLLRRLGANRIEQGRPQADCLLVHAMVPRDTELLRQATEAFAERALDEFTSQYYAADEAGQEAEGLWTVSDAQGSDAPHVPVPLSYDARLAYFNVIDDVADLLHDEKDYRDLAERIRSRFG